MEEIGSRATIFELESLGSEKKKYLKWLLMQSVAPKTKIESVFTDDAVGTLSEKLTTPLQFEYKVGQKPVAADMIENVLARDINGLEPRLTRQGYNTKSWQSFSTRNRARSNRSSAANLRQVEPTIKRLPVYRRTAKKERALLATFGRRARFN